MFNNMAFCCQAFFARLFCKAQRNPEKDDDTALIFFAKESGGVVSIFGLPKLVSNLLSPTKVKFN